MDFPRNNEFFVEGVIEEIAPIDWCEFGCTHDHLKIRVVVDTIAQACDEEARDYVYPVSPEAPVTTFFDEPSVYLIHREEGV